jgi:hypothetical protein
VELVTAARAAIRAGEYESWSRGWLEEFRSRRSAAASH